MEVNELSTAYKGSVATQYEADRVADTKWEKETEIVEKFIGKLPEGSNLLDVPCGTGRFFGLYLRRGFSVVGVDISEDMLEQARQNSQSNISLSIGSIFDLKFAEKSFDSIVCIRFLNWVSANKLEEVLEELVRVSRKNIFIGVRHKSYGFKAAFGRLKRRVRQRQNSKGIVFHNKRHLDSTIERLGLKISDLGLVEIRNDGTEYFIYHLVKD